MSAMFNHCCFSMKYWETGDIFSIFFIESLCLLIKSLLSSRIQIRLFQLCIVSINGCLVDSFRQFFLVIDHKSLLSSGWVLDLDQVAFRVDVGVLSVDIASLIWLIQGLKQVRLKPALRLQLFLFGQTLYCFSWFC